MAKAKSLLNSAITAIEYKDIPTKCQSISKVHAIADYLHTFLYLDVKGSPEGDLTQRLDGIFVHLKKQLTQANTKSSISKLEAGDLSSIKLLQNCLQLIVNIQIWWEKVGELQ